MKSIWSQNTEIAPRQPLEGDLETDVCVIGAGMAGVLAAYLLQEQGFRVAVLEASRIGSGQTKNTTAKITCQHGLIYAALIKNFGEALARQYAAANQEAIGQYRQMIQDENISCQFEETNAFLYSEKDDAPLLQELAAAQKLGIDARMAAQTGLPFAVKGALCFPGQAQFEPLAFLKAVSSRLTIYENTRAENLSENTVITNRGRVRAKYIVFATHYPFLNAPGYYFMRMHQERSYVLALSGAQNVGGMYYSIDPGGYSFRNFQNLLFLGGQNHRTGENDAGGRYEGLRQAARRLFPEASEAACWSAQDCVTLDGVPYIGRFSKDMPHVYVATGFHKWGMTTSMAAATIIRNEICKKDNPHAKVFSPRRFDFSASAKTMLEDGLKSVKGLAMGAFHIAPEALQNLPKGHGGIVNADGERAGVYKDDDGKIFVVRAKCPHLGCELSWNPDEKSWDCPCHGSRFDYMGNLIDNPAQVGIHTK